jgi:hypothetical protein
MTKVSSMSATERFWAKVDKSLGDHQCWNWQAAKLQAGYGQFKASSYIMHLAHRFSYELHFGPVPDGMYVCHRCDNPSCVNPAHLFAGEPKDNSGDMVAKGRNRSGILPGALNGNARLSLEQVKAIRNSNVSCRKLAAEYGVGSSQIHRIKQGQAWSKAA